MGRTSGGWWPATRRPSARGATWKGWFMLPGWTVWSCDSSPYGGGTAVGDDAGSRRDPRDGSALNTAGSVPRMAAVLVTSAIGAAAPPGVDPGAFGRALVEDSCGLVAGLELVVPAVVVSDGVEKELGGQDVGDLVWPGTQVVRLAPADGHGVIAQTLHALAALGAGQAAVLAADAPDLPPL